jgi:SsrA-binding protein
MAKKTKHSDAPQIRLITQNRKASHRFHVLDELECGLVLVGSEVKSLRESRVSIEEAYARLKDGELWLLNCDIPEYPDANRFNHQPKRPRKLLLHRHQLRQFAQQALEKGLTLVPLKMYFRGGKAKVLLGLCRGKQRRDKREAMKNAEVQREIRRQMLRRTRR